MNSKFMNSTKSPFTRYPFSELLHIQSPYLERQSATTVARPFAIGIRRRYELVHTSSYWVSRIDIVQSNGGDLKSCSRKEA